MRRPLVSVSVLVIAGAVVTACTTGGASAVKLRWLNAADAALHFEEDQRANRLRLYKVCGVYCWVPGPADRASSACNKGIEFTLIEGTTDGIESDEHQRLIHKAYAFAEQYNRKMIAHIERTTGRAVRDCG